MIDFQRNWFLVDRTKFNLYNISVRQVSLETHQSIIKALTDSEFTATQSDNLYSKLRLRRGMGMKCDMNIRYDAQNNCTRITMRIDINPTRLQHIAYAKNSRKTYPKSYDGNFNYIPLEIVEQEGFEQIHLQNLELLREKVLGFLKCLEIKINSIVGRQAFDVSVMNISVEQIEIYRDMHDDVIGRPLNFIFFSRNRLQNTRWNSTS